MRRACGQLGGGQVDGHAGSWAAGWVVGCLVGWAVGWVGMQVGVQAGVWTDVKVGYEQACGCAGGRACSQAVRRACH